MHNSRSSNRNQISHDLSSFPEPLQGRPNDSARIPPVIPDHYPFRCIGRGSYGEVWLARNVIGTWRAVKVVYLAAFESDRPYQRELDGIRRFDITMH